MQESVFQRMRQVLSVLLFAWVAQSRRLSGTELMVEHSLGPDSWFPRGRLSIDYGSKSGTLTAHEWTEQETDMLTQLCRDQGYYKLRMNHAGQELVSSVPCSSLMGGSERMILQTDRKRGISGFDYFIVRSGRNPGTRSNRRMTDIPDSLKRDVTVSLSGGERADSPLVPSYEAQPKKADPPSFWSRYWWIILLVGFMLLTNLAGAA